MTGVDETMSWGEREKTIIYYPNAGILYSSVLIKHEHFQGMVALHTTAIVVAVKLVNDVIDISATIVVCCHLQWHHCLRQMHVAITLPAPGVV